jgi:TolA-binding protein
MLLGGCATSADVAGLATQDEVLRLRTDVTALQRSVQQTKTQSEALSAQIASRPQTDTAEIERQAQATNLRLDALTSTVAALSKRVDELTTRIETLARQMRTSGVRPGPGAPPPRVASPPPAPPSPAPPTAAPATAVPAPTPSAAAPAVPATPAAPAAPPPPTAAPVTAAPAVPPVASVPPPAPSSARPTTGLLQPQDLYQAAYIDFSKGSYTLAIDGFREFLRRYSEHPLANSAQYWIGEGYAALAQQHANAGQAERATEARQRAVQEFRKVVANYPRGDRTPTALYKEALTLMELKQPALAQSRLQYLVDNFPQAEETPLARERLAALRQR